MAGIEKICEFSGEHAGYDMYGFKHNHIQIKPEYRKNFKGCAMMLIFYRTRPDDTTFVIKGNKLIEVNLVEYDLIINQEDPNSEWYDKLAGRVNGVYHNWYYTSSKKTTVIRKLRRLVGGKKFLTVVNHDNHREHRCEYQIARSQYNKKMGLPD